MPRTPLNETWDGLPALNVGAKIDGKSQITTLKNGLRVASIDSPSPIANVGVFVDAGSRYETQKNNGISHFLEHMAFKSTANRSDFRLVREMGKLGANLSCVASREHMMYSADVLRENVPYLVGTFADVLQNNLFDAMETADCASQYIADNTQRAEMADAVIMESIHQAAYFNNTLGLPLVAPSANVPSFTGEAMKAYMDTYFTGDRMVVSGVGIEHSELVALVDKMFGYLPESGTAPPRQPAQYTGGETRMHTRDSADGLTHFAVAFETASWNHKDLVPMCVLQMLMGGGGSFSAGGPGKGMYSRLYENVLNQYGWVDSANCFNSIFADSAIFGIYGTAKPEEAAHLVSILSQEATRMAGPVDPEELQRAKNALKSSVFMQLESRFLQLEDLGRQVITYGKVDTPEQIASLIDQVTAADITRVASDMLDTTPSVAAYGDLTYLPRYDAIAKAFK